MNHFNSVDQWAEHVGDRVARADEDALAEIEFEIQITVTELVRLFWVEELKQGRRDVPLH